MKKNLTKNIGFLLVIALWAILAAAAWLKPSGEISVSERRKLAQFPEFSSEALLSGDFVADFEDYTLDQFPLRDTFRKVKAWFHYNVLQQQDNNGIIFSEGYAAKLEYPLDEDSVSNALKKFNSLYEKYLKRSGCKVYAAVVPDKNYYLSGQGENLALDYGKMFELIQTGMPYARYVNLTDSLSLEDYYYTDTHWRQEKLFPAAQTLCGAMGIPIPRVEDYTVKEATDRFYGVYFGQAALPLEPEPLYILQNNMLSACRVFNHENNRYSGIYDMEKLNGNDPYDVYLSGATALLTIDNPQAKTNRELIVFRDSFGSSMIPLLVQGYKKVTVVDTRYISGDMLGGYVQFRGQDVLFLYSSLILNGSYVLK